MKHHNLPSTLMAAFTCMAAGTAWGQGQTVLSSRPVATAWSPHAVPGRASAVPDAALLGTGKSDPNFSSPIVAPAFLFLGCESRQGNNVPVIRFTIPSRLGIDAATIPSALPEQNVPIAARRLDMYVNGLWGKRTIYTVGKGQTYTMVQFDADPREMGRFAAADATGQEVNFYVNEANLHFQLPPPNTALLNVLSFCNVQPWLPGSLQGKTLSEAFLQAVIRAVQTIGATSFKRNQQLPEPPEVANLNDLVITELEFGVAFNIAENFWDVSSNETGIPVRRTRCVKALTAMLQTRLYQWPQACAYVEKEAPP